MKHSPVLNLQDIVNSYKDPAVLISESYEIIRANSAYMDLYNIDTHHPESSENECDRNFLEAEKCHCYEVSHHYSRSCDQEGESCPLQSAKITLHNQRVLHVHHTRFGEEHVDVSLYPVRDANENLYFLEVMKTIKHASPIARRGQMVGKSEAFKQMLSLINRVAQHDISVLLQGESGTGKELVAHAIHQSSQRHSSACVTVECSGLSESLFESELFGHEKGAFTGAINRKKGLVEEAQGGTLFLDEIGDVPMALQVKLLRLIETRTFRRVGGVEQLKADFRLVCATHKNLKGMIRRGEFREDLYYRISTFPIALPPLRERISDIPVLVDTILERICRQKKVRVSKDVILFFKHYAFPGNIRQLRNILEYGRVMTDSSMIELQHLPVDLMADSCFDTESFAVNNNQALKGDKQSKPIIEHAITNQSANAIVSLEQNEQNYLSWINDHYEGDNKSLAERLGISERTLYRKMKMIEK